MNVKTISPQELQRHREAGKVVELIDVRTPVEYAEIHVEGARLMPLDTLDPRAFASAGNGEPLYVICRSGSRAAKAYEKFQAAGVDNVLSIEGGTLAWERAGLPVVRGQKVISLERQVRIAAGLLVMLGVVLGWLVHPSFLGLSAFVGAGLVFAGLTDTCGMGLMLAKMPWNQVEECGSSCSS
ncbi:rhodanese-like domain-containing protein [Novipirellula maiorica]|nr:rhodanese-like domain-containing protein [Rhodopirellula maiorica]